MASFIAAVAAASSKTSNAPNPLLSHLANFQLNAAAAAQSQSHHHMLQSSSSSPQGASLLSSASSSAGSDFLAANPSVFASAFKYNSLFNSLQQQPHELSSAYSSASSSAASLAKYMAFYYNKPIEYIQRLLNEQHATNSTVTHQPPNDLNQYLLNTNNVRSASPQQPYVPLAGNNSTYHSVIQSKHLNHRFHPYLKNTNTNNESAKTTCSVDTSPKQAKLGQTQTIPISRSPSPCSSPKLIKTSPPESPINVDNQANNLSPKQTS